jgi:hypothetical protein
MLRVSKIQAYYDRSDRKEPVFRRTYDGEEEV